MAPLRRELEQLRTQSYAEGNFAVTFRRMEEEKKEMQQILDLLRKEYDTLLAKNEALLDDFTVSLLSVIFVYET